MFDFNPTFQLAGYLLAAGWIVSEGLLVWRQQSKNTGASRRDRGSLALVLGMILVAIAIACVLPHWTATGLFPGWVQALGLLWMVMGVALRRWSVRILGKFFTVDVAVHAEQHVIQEGPYRWLRHPSYTGFGMTLAGLGLALGHPLGVAVLLIVPIPGFLWRVHVEEDALTQAFGDQYREYQKKTWRIIPLVY